MKLFGLREDCSCSFRARQIGAIPNTPNIRILLMPQSLFIAVQVASLISQARLIDIRMWPHGWHGMKEIKLADN